MVSLTGTPLPDNINTSLTFQLSIMMVIIIIKQQKTHTEEHDH